MKAQTMKKIMVFVLMLALMLSLVPVAEQASAASKPAKPKISVAVADDGASATITIGKTKRAQGFQVVAKLPGADEFTEIATLEVDGKEKRSYTLENVPGGEYSVKVRAYKVKNGNKVWGKYSKVKTLTIVNTETFDDLGIEPGDIIQLGSFEQDGNTENGAEPIDWIVLSKENGKLYLTSEYVLAPGTIDNGAFGYNSGKKYVTAWSQSGMREWLNGEFLSSSFTEAEAAIIADTDLEEEGCTDKIFLLSRNDVKNEEYGFVKNAFRACIPTYHAIRYVRTSDEEYDEDEDDEEDYCEGVWIWDDGENYEIKGEPACYWWLRTVNNDDKEFYVVNDDGSIGRSTSDGIDYYAGHSDEDEEYYIEDGGIGIRPAMVINITAAAKNVIVKTEKNMQDEWSSVEWAEDEFDDDDDDDEDERDVYISIGKVKKLKKAKAGDIIEFGTYEQDNNFLNGKEPIRWRVLAKDDNGLLVMSVSALECKPYNKKYKAELKWEDSSIRKWLNGDFYNNAFSEAEKKKIQTCENDDLVAHPSEEWVRVSEDKVYLLSEMDLTEYYTELKNLEVRACLTTEYTCANGIKAGDYVWDNYECEYICYWVKDENSTNNSNEPEICSWWLRTRKDDKVLVCDMDGYIKELDMNTKNIGVRPAMVISLK